MGVCVAADGGVQREDAVCVRVRTCVRSVRVDQCETMERARSWRVAIRLRASRR